MAVSASSCIVASLPPSTTRPSSASTATPSTLRWCSTSMPARSRSRCPMPASASCRCRRSAEDHYATTAYGAGPHTLTRDAVGTRYVMVGIRTLVNPTDPEDVRKVHAFQDAMTISQASPGQLETPQWDPASQKKVRDALLVLATTLPDTKRMFGTKEQVDPVRHLIGSASAWGGNNEKDALYLNIVPGRNDGTTVYRLTSRMFRSMASGRSASTMPRAIISPIPTTPTHSTTSPPRRVRTVPSWSNSAVATARLPTACRPCRAGTTWSGCTVHARRS